MWSAALFLVPTLVAASTFQSPSCTEVSEIWRNKQLRCGYLGSFLSSSLLASEVDSSGFYRDFCRGMAASIFGQLNDDFRIEETFYNLDEHMEMALTDLHMGTTDILIGVPKEFSPNTLDYFDAGIGPVLSPPFFRAAKTALINTKGKNETFCASKAEGTQFVLNGNAEQMLSFNDYLLQITDPRLDSTYDFIFENFGVGKDCDIIVAYDLFMSSFINNDADVKNKLMDGTYELFRYSEKIRPDLGVPLMTESQTLETTGFSIATKSGNACLAGAVSTLINSLYMFERLDIKKSGSTFSKPYKPITHQTFGPYNKFDWVAALKRTSVNYRDLYNKYFTRDPYSGIPRKNTANRNYQYDPQGLAHDTEIELDRL